MIFEEPRSKLQRVIRTLKEDIDFCLGPGPASEGAPTKKDLAGRILWRKEHPTGLPSDPLLKMTDF